MSQVLPEVVRVQTFPFHAQPPVVDRLVCRHPGTGILLQETADEILTALEETQQARQVKGGVREAAVKGCETRAARTGRSIAALAEDMADVEWYTRPDRNTTALFLSGQARSPSEGLGTSHAPHLQPSGQKELSRSTHLALEQPPLYGETFSYPFTPFRHGKTNSSYFYKSSVHSNTPGKLLTRAFSPKMHGGLLLCVRSSEDHRGLCAALIVLCTGSR